MPWRVEGDGHRRHECVSAAWGGYIYRYIVFSPSVDRKWWWCLCYALCSPEIYHVGECDRRLERRDLGSPPARYTAHPELTLRGAHTLVWHGQIQILHTRLQQQPQPTPTCIMAASIRLLFVGAVLLAASQAAEAFSRGEWRSTRSAPRAGLV